MVYAAWFSAMNAKNDKGVTLRDSLLVASRNPRHTSHARSVRMLQGPPFPDSLLYLWNWLLDIRRGLGVGFNGLNELSWVVLDAWRRLNDVDLAPDEAVALMSLDGVIRHPESIGELAWS